MKVKKIILWVSVSLGSLIALGVGAVLLWYYVLCWDPTLVTTIATETEIVEMLDALGDDGISYKIAYKNERIPDYTIVFVRCYFIDDVTAVYDRMPQEVQQKWDLRYRDSEDVITVESK